MEQEKYRRRKVGLITSCNFKQACLPGAEESSIFGEAREEGGDAGRWRERESRLVE